MIPWLTLIKGEAKDLEPLIKLEEQDCSFSAETEIEQTQSFNFSNSDDEYESDNLEDEDYKSEDIEHEDIDIKKNVRVKKKRKVKIDKQELIDENFEIKCNKCEKTCVNTGSLIKHLTSCNPEQIKDVPTAKPKKDFYGPTGKSFSCKYCGKLYEKLKSLKKHELLHKTDPENKKLKKCQMRMGASEMKKKCKS